MVVSLLRTSVIQYKTLCTEEHQWTQGWRRTRQDAMPASRGRIFNASLLSQASQASPGQSRLWRGQFRLRRTKRAAWIRNAEGCRLGKALQEVMPLRRRPVRSAVNGPPLMFQNRFWSPDPRPKTLDPITIPPSCWTLLKKRPSVGSRKPLRFFCRGERLFARKENQ